MRERLLLLASVLSSAAPKAWSAQSDDAPRLRIGNELHLRLTSGTATPAVNRVIVEVDSSGPLVLLAQSADCDVTLRWNDEVLDGDGCGAFGERLELPRSPPSEVPILVGSAVPIPFGADVVLTLTSADSEAKGCDIAGRLDELDAFLDHSGSVDGGKLRRVACELAMHCLFADERRLLGRVAGLLERAPANDGKLGAAVVRALAKTNAERARELGALRSRLGDLPPDTDALCLFGLAEAAIDAQDAKAAVDFLCDGIELLRGRRSVVLEAALGSALGTVRRQMSDSEGAKQAFEDAIRAAGSSGGPAVVGSLLRCVDWMTDAGETAAAADLAERALLVRGATRTQRLDLGSRLCVVDLMAGRPEAAAAHFTAIRQSIDEGSPDSTPNEILVALAHSLYRMGRFAESRELIDRVVRNARGDASPVRGQALLVRSLLLEEDDRLDDATRAIDAALREFADHEGFDWDRCSCLLDRARLNRLAGRLDPAGDDLRAALLIATDRHLELHRLGAFDGLAALALARHDLGAARRNSESAVAGYRRLSQWDLLLDALLTQANLELAQRDLGRAGAVLDEAHRLMAGTEALDPLAAAEMRSRQFAWSRFAQDLAQARIESSDDSTAQESMRWGLAQSELWRARALFAGLHARRGPQPGSAPSVEKLQESLSPTTLLVEFATGSTRLRAYVVGKNTFEVVDLGAVDDLPKRAERYRVRLLERPDFGDAAGVAAEGNALYRRLLEPILSVSREVPEQLIVVPNEFLEALPFEALVMEAPAGTKSFREIRFVLDEISVTLAPSAAVLVALGSPRASSSAHQALFVADPDYAASGSGTPGIAEPAGKTRRPAASYWQQLPKSRSEVIAIADLLIAADQPGAAESRARLRDCSSPQRPDVHLPETSFELLLGREANASFFARGDMKSYDILHFATHAFVDPRNPSHSGLVLSGSTDAERILDVEAIDRMDLDAELVVLAACGTAGGPVLKGEGTLSLSRAFLVRGARSVVATLAAIEDGEVTDLMKCFYRHLLSGHGLPPALALTEAQREIRHLVASPGARPIGGNEVHVLDCAHPYFWAQFVHVGFVADR